MANKHLPEVPSMTDVEYDKWEKRPVGDKRMRVAIYLKYGFAGLATGMDNKDWLEAAEDILRLLGPRTGG